MAHCPNCGSDHVQLKKETEVNWGRAAAGWALFGVVGGAVGAMTGEDRNVNACLDCGTSWKAADLYKTLQTIKSLTGETLNLVREEHREYMNSFMSEVGPSLGAVSEIEKKYAKLIADKKKTLNKGAATGCGYGFIVWLIFIFFRADSIGGDGLLVTLILFLLIGWRIGGAASDKANKKHNDQWIENTNREEQKERRLNNKNVQLKVREFMKKYS